MSILHDNLRGVLDFILPERCPACGTITAQGGNFCMDCWPKLKLLTPPWCAACAMPIEFIRDDNQICASCLADPPLHDGVRAVAAYGEVSRQLILRLKHNGKIGLAKLIAAQMKRHLPEDQENLLIVPVPLHWTRLWSRGYNQSALIAKALAQHSKMQFVPDMLLRTKRTPVLRGFSGKERKQIVGSAFRVNPKYAGKLAGAHVILVDDVLTSGSTSNACIKILKKAGADWTQVFCWARVLRGEAASQMDALVYDA